MKFWNNYSLKDKWKKLFKIIKYKNFNKSSKMINKHKCRYTKLIKKLINYLKNCTLINKNNDFIYKIVFNVNIKVWAENFLKKVHKFKLTV
jgi:hypothetical protein